MTGIALLTRRVAGVVVVSLAIGCGRSEPAARRDSSAADVERARLESIMSRIPARDLCPEPLDAPSRRANYKAANERHARTIDTISRLDWRTASISESQIEALNTAKLQINRAEVIDLAIALQQDYRPPAGKRVEAAYREHGPTVERLASDRWETSDIGNRDSKALARAGELFLAARQIDLAESLASDPGPHAAAMIVIEGADVRRLAAKDWRNQGPTEAETRALGNVVNAHLHDLAVALARVIDLDSANPVREAYQPHREILQPSALPKGLPLSSEQETAVCQVLRLLPGKH